MAAAEAPPAPPTPPTPTEPPEARRRRRRRPRRRSVRCRARRLLRPVPRHSRPAIQAAGATVAIANRPPGAAATCRAFRSADGIVGLCWRITWTWMASRAASAGQLPRGVAAATPTSPPPAKQAGPANAVSVTFVTGSAELQPFAADSAEATCRDVAGAASSRSPATAMPPRTTRPPSPRRSLSACRAPRRWPRR